MDSVKLIIGDKCMGILEAVGKVFPKAKCRRCAVHFYYNMFSIVPGLKVKLATGMLKKIHAQESEKASREKARASRGEAEGGGEEDRRRCERDADLLRFPVGALDTNPHRQCHRTVKP